jgi:SAM-dependent methyltransferase
MKWNERWKERGAPGEPSSFLRELDDLLPRVGRALDVAGGAGRHALWLARRGLDVTLVDISDEALAIARAAGEPRLTTLALDLDHQPLPAGPFDLITLFFFLDRRVYAELPMRLAPGGMVIVVHPTRTNLERHASPAAQFLLAPGELPRLVPGVEILRHEEYWSAEGRHEARLVARRRPPA